MNNLLAQARSRKKRALLQLGKFLGWSFVCELREKIFLKSFKIKEKVGELAIRRTIAKKKDKRKFCKGP
jgi:hypothetical protein